MSDFESTKAVLMDLLAEHGDEAQVEVLRNLDAVARMWRGRRLLWAQLRGAERNVDGECSGCYANVGESDAGGWQSPHDLDCEVLAALAALDPEEAQETEWNRAWEAAHREQERRARATVRATELAANPNAIRTSVETLSGLFREVYREALPSLARIGASDLSFHSDPPPPQSPLRFTKPNPAAESYEAKLEQARRFLDAGLISDQQFTDIIAGRSPLQTSTGLVVADKMPKPR